MASKIHDLKELLDMLNTPGGHIAISVALGLVGLFTGGWGVWYVWPDEKLAALILGLTAHVTAFFSIAAYAMRGSEKANGKGNPTEPPKEGQ